MFFVSFEILLSSYDSDLKTLFNQILVLLMQTSKTQHQKGVSDTEQTLPYTNIDYYCFGIALGNPQKANITSKGTQWLRVTSQTILAD